jgi:hypothetical protein
MTEGNPPAPVSDSEPVTPEPGAPAAAPEAPAAAPEAPATVTPAPAPGPARRPRPEWLTPLIVIAIAMIVLTVVSTSAVLMIGGSAAPTYPPGYWQGSALSSSGPWPIAVQSYGPGDVSKYDASTPESAFKSYINAISTGDRASADQMLSARARSIGDSSSLIGPTIEGSYSSVTIESSRVTGDTATLNVTIHSSFGDGVGTSTMSRSEIVGLVREGDTWKIDTEEDS